MPRHPIRDAHEWISEIPAVPNCHSVKPQGKGTVLHRPAGKEDPVEFDSSLVLCSDMIGVAEVGGLRNMFGFSSEIPLLSPFLHLPNDLGMACSQ
jgi:hypothetical protein